MHKGRLEAFSDGVLAIIITIMVLELKVPHESSLTELLSMYPIFVSYILSFIFVGIYWNNHHHMMQAAERINGATLWANLHLLFWLSLVPFSTAWMGESHFAEGPVAFYGFILLMSGVAYYILAQSLLRHHGKDSTIGRALGSDFKGKLSLVMYLVALGFSHFNTWVSYGLYIAVALMWLYPDPRIEKEMN